MVVCKYWQIAQDLSEKIKHGQYATGALLPSETDLTHLYNTSRETIRKALAELSVAGLIQKVKGKGSIVLNTARFAFHVSDIVTFNELNQSEQMRAQTKVLQLKNQQLPADISSRMRLRQPPATFIQRLRIVNEEPVIVDEDYILKKFVPVITKEQAQNSLYSYFENDLGLKIAYATKMITVETAPADITKLLKLATTDLVVFVRSLTYLQDTSFFQYTISMHRPDKFKFVDFAHRKKL